MKSQWICRFAFCLLLLPAALAAIAQSKDAAPPPSDVPAVTPPPIKMGLWKTTNTATMAGLQLPPEVAARLQAMGKTLGQPTTVNTLSCITAEKWQQMFNGQHNQNCTFSNVQQSSSNMSADISCTSHSGNGNTTGHMDMTFDSDTAMHGKFHMNVTMESQPNPMTLDSTFQGTYQGSDCQGISPDSPKIVH